MHQRIGVVAFAIGVLVIAASCATRPAPPLSGSALYAANCASCHGRYADGMGPVSADIAIPDLRYLTADNGGVFPGTQIVAIIDGRRIIKAHAGRQMPVWGATFAAMAGGDAAAEAQVTAKIKALVGYLETIQQSR